MGKCEGNEWSKTWDLKRTIEMQKHPLLMGIERWHSFLETSPPSTSYYFTIYANFMEKYSLLWLTFPYQRYISDPFLVRYMWLDDFTFPSRFVASPSAFRKLFTFELGDGSLVRLQMKFQLGSPCNKEGEKHISCHDVGRLSEGGLGSNVLLLFVHRLSCFLMMQPV